MSLHQLVYTSTAVRPFSAGELEQLLAGARRRNAEAGLTGLLILHDGLFLHLLEGPEAPLRATYAAIRADRRHRGIRRISSGPLQARDFPEAPLAFLDTAESAPELGAEVAPALAPAIDLGDALLAARRVHRVLRSLGPSGV